MFTCACNIHMCTHVCLHKQSLEGYIAGGSRWFPVGWGGGLTGERLFIVYSVSKTLNHMVLLVVKKKMFSEILFLVSTSKRQA